jgi:SNF family Na+-dependent transporter
MVKHLLFPLYSLAQSYSAPTLERIDLFFMAVWFPAFGMTLRMYLFTLYHSITKLLKINKKTLTLIILVLMLIAASRLFKDFNQLSKYAVLTDTIGIPPQLILVILNYVLSFFVKKGTTQK